MNEDYYLEFSENPIRFDSVSQLTNVFFDDTNGQVFAVRSGGVTGVIVKGPDLKSCTTFRMEDKGRVISIKFSPDLNVLAVQRSHTSVDFINFSNLAPTSVEYNQPCKWKSGSILGFYWIKSNEIAFITDHGIELLQVIAEKKQLKTLKTVKINASWFSWCVQSKLVLIASSNGTHLNPFTFSNSNINKLPRVEMEGPVSDCDVSCTRLYDSSWCLVLRQGGKCPAEVIAMPLDVPGNIHQIHALRTGLIGRFAINVVDNLVVVHHQASQTSMLFDIMDEGTTEKDIKVHTPIAPPKSLKPFTTIPDLPCQMYSGNWVVFRPDIVIDARLGCLWHVKLIPGGLTNNALDKVVGVLLRRTNGEKPIFEILKHMIEGGIKYLTDLLKVFDQINAVYRKQAEIELVKQTGQCSNQNDNNNIKEQHAYHKIVISQQDIYTNVLQRYTDSPHIIQVVLNYMCSLARHQVSPQHALTEMLVRALVRANKFSDLHQLLQYGAIGDSKPLACLLLSLANLHPAAHQLALDMLHRLNAHEETVEVLLGEGEVIAGVGVAKQYSLSSQQFVNQMQFNGQDVWNTLRARKLLSVAQKDVNTFISVYHALENRNRINRNSQSFIKGEQCDSFVQLYSMLFPDINDR